MQCFKMPKIRKKASGFDQISYHMSKYTVYKPLKSLLIRVHFPLCGTLRWGVSVPCAQTAISDY